MTDWRPLPRPGWVTTLNTVGAHVGPEAIVPLDEESLLDAARVRVGLGDFGEDDWREPFGLMIGDLAEADLTLTGRLLARIDIVRSLEVRLQMTEVEALHPEILEQPVVAPIFITGLGRSGTSILLELMGQDPGLRPGLGWEFRYPSPPPIAGRPDRGRIAMANADLDLWEQVIPELRAIHETAIEGPDEDSMAHMHAFVSGIWSAVHRLPSLEAWVARDRSATALRFHRRVLQHLLWATPGRVVGKNPSYVSALPSVFEEFPDATVVMMHRDPCRVLASAADMFATLRWQRSDRVDHAEIVQRISTGYPVALDRMIRQRDGGAVPADRVVDVRYADLMADHLATITAVYDQLGLTLSDAAAGRMRDYLARRPKDRHGGRSYALTDLGLDLDHTRRAFTGYLERFGVPEEA